MYLYGDHSFVFCSVGRIIRHNNKTIKLFQFCKGTILSPESKNEHLVEGTKIKLRPVDKFISSMGVDVQTAIDVAITSG